MSQITLDRNRLSQCRQNLGISKQEASRRMNMSQPAYVRYESGERTPSLHTIRTMAAVLNTSVEYLTGQTDDPNPTIYVVNSKDDPELFHFVEIYRSSEDDMKNRLLEYVKNWDKQK